ncbi:MAG: type IV pilus twitching motility protein PilT [Deltaproteobacteria bacterium]|nr:type IV pilus twitching motility protein PilT [Nannocystaceae bacterium]
MVESGATDLHITTGAPPQLRIDGDLVPLKVPKLGPVETKQLCYSILNDKQKHRFEEELELDLSFGVKGLARFRANVFQQRGATCAAFRLIPYDIPPLETLGLPQVVRSLTKKPRGLVLVTGPTGSGKSTSLASMIDVINHELRGHILTIEDPIEYLHQHGTCVVNQREVGADTKSFKNALKYSLRQDPDVILLGEMRDEETMEAALTLAETGHLTFGTLHTNSAVQTINRVIDMFPSHRHSQVRTQLSFVLEGVMCQSLLPKPDGGRALAVEVLIPTDGIRALIRDAKLHQIYSQMQLGQGVHEMQTFNQSLADLVTRGQVSEDVAMRRSSDPNELRSILESGKGLHSVQRRGLR